MPRAESGKAKPAPPTAPDLEIRLRRMGLEPVSYRTARPAGMPVAVRRVTRRDLIVFCFHLEQALRAGVPVVESLQDLRDSADNPRLREVCASLLEAIEGGSTLSEALCGVSGRFQ